MGEQGETWYEFPKWKTAPTPVKVVKVTQHFVFLAARSGKPYRVAKCDFFRTELEAWQDRAAYERRQEAGYLESANRARSIAETAEAAVARLSMGESTNVDE